MKVRGTQENIPLTLEFNIDTVYVRSNIERVEEERFSGWEYDEDQYTYAEYMQKQQADNETDETVRAHWLDAYRKYQAAVAFGEIKRDEGIEAFIKRLKDRDFTALSEVPSGLRYFAGEASWAESGLIKL